MNESEWKSYARIFGENWCRAFGGDAVTSYVHCFVYHIGFYLEKYDVSVFANFSTEGRHKFNKISSQFASSGLRPVDSNKGFTYQLLARSTRMSFPQTFPVPNLHELQNPRKDNWIQRTLVQFSGTDFPLTLAPDPGSCNSTNP
jgi:hypothetical protein